MGKVDMLARHQMETKLRCLAAGALAVVVGVVLHVTSAQPQGATVQIHPDTAVPPDVIYPDAVVCTIRSSEGINYNVIFYKSQTISFAHEPNNAAEYGTTFIRDPQNFDPTIPYKWRLQLGKPGNITVLTVPSGWTSTDCPIGKSIDNLTADKQILKLFTNP